MLIRAIEELPQGWLAAVTAAAHAGRLPLQTRELARQLTSAVACQTCTRLATSFGGLSFLSRRPSPAAGALWPLSHVRSKLWLVSKRWKRPEQPPDVAWRRLPLPLCRLQPSREWSQLLLRSFGPFWAGGTRGFLWLRAVTLLGRKQPSQHCGSASGSCWQRCAEQAPCCSFRLLG